MIEHCAQKILSDLILESLDTSRAQGGIAVFCTAAPFSLAAVCESSPEEMPACLLHARGDKLCHPCLKKMPLLSNRTLGDGAIKIILLIQTGLQKETRYIGDQNPQTLGHGYRTQGKFHIGSGDVLNDALVAMNVDSATQESRPKRHYVQGRGMVKPCGNPIGFLSSNDIEPNQIQNLAAW
mmetsp:Transcript_11352/g.23275  ORF Transcript_11352/g.23275 Transcript_11352/m.23275 type:complete len:181 (-) Transcript_11352:480-1022(-)